MKHANNFDILRLIAACMVFVAHAYMLTDSPQPFLLYGNSFLHIGSIGVTVFFVISGYLITQSYVRNKDAIINYTLARFLRIYPAVLVQFIVFGLLWRYKLSDFDLNGYLKQLSGFTGFFTGPLDLQDSPFPANRNVWTLLYEIRMYIVIPLIIRFRMLWPAVIGYGAYLALSGGFNPHDLPSLGLLHCWTFLLGSMMYTYRKAISVNGYAAVLALIVAVTTNPFFYTVGMAYVVYYLAFMPWKFNAAKYGDFSYGIYLYGFPPLYFSHYQILYSFIFTILFAIISWHLIEKPALSLKNIRVKKGYCIA